MTFKELALELCTNEGKLKEVNIAQMREILKCLKEIFKEKPVEVLSVLMKK